MIIPTNSQIWLQGWKIIINPLRKVMILIDKLFIALKEIVGNFLVATLLGVFRASV